MRDPFAIAILFLVDGSELLQDPVLDMNQAPGQWLDSLVIVG